ncbi:MAG: T9SS type A sorting domain-containing protein [Saprospiraceae bacterium]
MKLIIFTFVLFLFSSVVCAQTEYLPVRPYEPIQFTGIQPVWYHTIKDTTPNKGDGNGYNFLNFSMRCRPEVKDNYLYTSYQTSSRGDVAGSYLEKRDILSGEVTWQYLYGLNDVKYPEVARSIIFVEDSVRLLSWKAKDTLGTWPPFVLAGIDVTLTERSFSNENGALGAYFSTTKGDSTVHKFTANPLFRNKVEYILKDPDTDGYRCIYHEHLTNPKYVLSVPIDRYGRENGTTDTISTELLTSFYALSQEGGKVLINRLVNGQMHLTLYADARLSTAVDDWVLEDFNTKDFSYIMDIDGENTIWTHNPNTNDEVISVYHRGVLISRVSVPPYYHYNSFAFVDGQPIGVSGYDFISNRQDVVCIQDNQFKVKQSLVSEDTLRYLLVFNVTPVNGLLIIHSQEGSWALDEDGERVFDYPSKANSIMAFSLESLGIISHTDDRVATDLVSIYPNPAQENVTITFDSPSDGVIEVINLRGDLMQKIHDKGRQSQTIDISDWPSGMYIISINDKVAKTFVKL